MLPFHSNGKISEVLFFLISKVLVAPRRTWIAHRQMRVTQCTFWLLWPSKVWTMPIIPLSIFQQLFLCNLLVCLLFHTWNFMTNNANNKNSEQLFSTTQGFFICVFYNKKYLQAFCITVSKSRSLCIWLFAHASFWYKAGNMDKE